MMLTTPFPYVLLVSGWLQVVAACWSVEYLMKNQKFVKNFNFKKSKNHWINLTKRKLNEGQRFVLRDDQVT